MSFPPLWYKVTEHSGFLPVAVPSQALPTAACSLSVTRKVGGAFPDGISIQETLSGPTTKSTTATIALP